jgi:hypothetical protein
MKSSTAKNRPGTQNKRCTRIKNIREHSRKAAYCQFLEKEISLIGSVERNRVLPEPDPLVSRYGIKKFKTCSIHRIGARYNGRISLFAWNKRNGSNSLPFVRLQSPQCPPSQLQQCIFYDQDNLDTRCSRRA